MKADKANPAPRGSDAAAPRGSDAAAPRGSDAAAPREPEAAAPAVGNGGASAVDAVGVDKIRDLLFGNQMQDYDRRFTKLEERFLQRFKDIELETARNLGAFELNSKKHVDLLAGQLSEEKDQRADADKEIERVLREQNQALEKRIRVDVGPARSTRS